MKKKTKKIETSTKKREGAETNPFGSNQWLKDPRQAIFLSHYLDPKSPTFSNILQSGIKAGFSQTYSENLLSQMPTWLSEKLGNLSPMFLKAEQNLGEYLELPSKTQAMGAFGPLFEKVKVAAGKFKNGKAKFKTEKKPILTYNQGLLQKKLDTSIFIAERLGRKVYGPKEPEVSPTFNLFVFADEQRIRIAQRITGGRSIGDPASA